MDISQKNQYPISIFVHRACIRLCIFVHRGGIVFQSLAHHRLPILTAKNGLREARNRRYPLAILAYRVRFKSRQRRDSCAKPRAEAKACRQFPVSGRCRVAGTLPRSKGTPRPCARCRRRLPVAHSHAAARGRR